MKDKLIMDTLKQGPFFVVGIHPRGGLVKGNLLGENLPAIKRAPVDDT